MCVEVMLMHLGSSKAVCGGLRTHCLLGILCGRIARGYSGGMEKLI